MDELLKQWIPNVVAYKTRFFSSLSQTLEMTVRSGLIAFVIYLIRTTMGRFTPAQATAAMAVSYYWHFVDVVWIGVFVVIYIIQ